MQIDYNQDLFSERKPNDESVLPMSSFLIVEKEEEVSYFLIHRNQVTV